jgi:hypothetical protein
MVNFISVYLFNSIMQDYITVSAKVPRRLKELLDKYGIRPGPLIRQALEEEVRRVVLRELEGEIKGISEEMKSISDEEVVRLIREDRRRR